MKDILKEIRNLSQHDKNRLFQCVFCAKDPENATNGDMIKALFPTKTFIREDDEVGDDDTVFDLSWWNSPYKRGETE